MYTANPFTNLTVFLSPLFLQVYIVLMIIAVAAGTIYDLINGRKTKFFSQQREKSRSRATRHVSGARATAIVTKTFFTNVAVSGEFHSMERRVSHLLMLYGFVFYLLTTIIMIFAYPTDLKTPVVLPVLWNLGTLMILAGGIWFFFFLRVNVSHDGDPKFKLIRADIFIVSLVLSALFAMILELTEVSQYSIAIQVVFVFYILFTTILFVSVPWSKFSHMFYKPSVAIQRNLEEASGSSDLPSPSNGPRGGV